MDAEFARYYRISSKREREMSEQAQAAKRAEVIWPWVGMVAIID